MAWIYFRESVGLASQSSALESERSPIVSLTDTLRASYCPLCDEVTLTKPPYGTTCEVSKVKCSPKSKSSRADFPVRISALPALERAWKESDLDYSSRLPDSLALFDQDSFSWKMSQPSLFEGLIAFFWSSLRWGMMRGGRLYQLKALAPVIGVKGSFFLPTPTASIEGSNCSPNSTNRRLGLTQLARRGLIPTPMARDGRGGTSKNRNSKILPDMVNGPLNPAFVEELMGYRIGWTALSASVIPWYQSKLKKRL